MRQIFKDTYYAFLSNNVVQAVALHGAEKNY